MIDIRTARKEAGLTQEELARKLNINRATLSKYESGGISPTIEMLAKIAEALGSPFIELFLADTDDFSVKTRSKLDAIRAEYEERDRRIAAIIEAKFAKQADSFVASPVGRSIIDAFYNLNEYGQEEAMERIIELTFLPQFSNNNVPSEWKDYVDGYLRDRYATKYQRTEPPTSEEQPEGNTDITAKEKPPEGNTQPNDGI